MNNLKHIKPKYHVDDEDIDIPQHFKSGGNTKVVIANFHELLGMEDEIKVLNAFVIKKLTHFNSISTTINYINYFIEYYDLDRTFVTNYCRVKSITDKSYVSDTYSIDMFIDLLNKYILNPETRAKVELMTEDNFNVIDYENNLFKGNDSLKFTNEHCKLLMNISLFFKLIIPIANHFIYLKNIQNEAVNDFLLKIFYAIVKVFDDNGINIVNKIFSICSSKSNTMAYKHAMLWKQLYPIYGKSPDSFMLEKLLTPILIAIIPKYTYNKSMLSLNKTVIEQAIDGERSWNTPFINKEINDIDRDEDGLSALDKIEINMIKNDESELLVNRIIIEETINDLMETYGPITSDEFEYYMNESDHIDETQRDIINLIFANSFGSTRILDYIKKIEYIKLIIIMKRRLLRRDFKLLPYLLSGRVKKKTRKKISNKLMDKISPLYQSILDGSYSYASDIIKQSEIIERLIYVLAYSEIEFVDYEREEYRGQLIDASPDIVASEVLRIISTL